jgi:hypothetical protein
VHPRGTQAVSSNTNEANKTLGASLKRCLQGTSWPHGCLPFLLLGQVVQLEEIHRTYPEPFQRPEYLIARFRSRSFSGLGGEEEHLAVSGDPRAYSQFRLAIGWSGVDMIDTKLKRQFDRIVSLWLRDLP